MRSNRGLVAAMLALLICSVVSNNAFTAGLFDNIGSYGKIISGFMSDQTIADLQRGVLNLSDSTVNQMLEITAGGSADNSVQAVNVEFMDGNRIKATVRTKEVSYQIEARILTFVHNKNVSEATLEVEKMRILDGGIINGFKNIILSMCSVETLFRWFATPKFENGLTVTAKNNVVDVNFHEWLYKTKFGSMMFLGKSVLNTFNVQKVETAEHNIKLYVALAL